MMEIHWSAEDSRGLSLGQLRMLVAEADRLHCPDEMHLHGETFLSLKSPPAIKKLVIR